MLCDAPLSSLATIGNSVSLINVDLPDPETPVMQVNNPACRVRSMFFRLLPRRLSTATACVDSA